MAETKFDVAVIGAGPAGCTAAILLAKKGRQVVLIDREKPGRKNPCAGWLNVRTKSLLDQLGCEFPAGSVTPFSNVMFYNADGSKNAAPKLDGPVGSLVDRERFDGALMQHAVSLGVHLLQGEEAGELRLSESHVSLKLSTSALQSRLLVLATGRAQELVSRVGFAQRGDVPIWVAQVEAPMDSKKHEPRVAVILGLDSRGSFGFCAVSPDRCTLSVNLVGGEAGATAPALAQLCKMAVQRGLIGQDLSAQATKVKPIRSPAGWALDMDTHVGKHTLLVGDAGGFVAAASNEGLYPAMWSAGIAAEVIDKALGSPYSQDELMTFDSQWRTQLADHLRAPHTDVRFLLPLIFSNQAMADRMAAAFFFGENI